MVVGSGQNNGTITAVTVPSRDDGVGCYWDRFLMPDNWLEFFSGSQEGAVSAAGPGLVKLGGFLGGGIIISPLCQSLIGQVEDAIFDGEGHRLDVIKHAGDHVKLSIIDQIVGAVQFAGGSAYGAYLGTVEFTGDGFGDNPTGYGDRKSGFAENGPEGGEGGIFIGFDAVEKGDGDGGGSADGIGGI